MRILLIELTQNEQNHMYHDVCTVCVNRFFCRGSFFFFLGKQESIYRFNMKEIQKDQNTVNSISREFRPINLKIR